MYHSTAIQSRLTYLMEYNAAPKKNKVDRSVHSRGQAKEMRKDQSEVRGNGKPYKKIREARKFERERKIKRKTK